MLNVGHVPHSLFFQLHAIGLLSKVLWGQRQERTAFLGKGRKFLTHGCIFRGSSSKMHMPEKTARKSPSKRGR